MRWPAGRGTRLFALFALAFALAVAWSAAAGDERDDCDVVSPRATLEWPRAAEARTFAEPPALDVELVVEGVFWPTAAAAPAGDERLFVAQKSGVVSIVRAGALLEQPFMDISERVAFEGFEQGLLSIAFHPRYPDEGRLFAFYTAAPDGARVLAEYRASADDPDRADVDSAVELIRVEHPTDIHNSGLIAFGPDGMLYLSIGEGGHHPHACDSHALDPTTLLGSLLRIDVSQPGTYATPPDNPFADGAGGAPEVWAYGLRNPWRFAFDLEQGLLYIADVGETTWEWVTVAPAGLGGLNYGWPITEGSACFDPPLDCRTHGLVMPVLEYGREDGCAIIGGPVYRGSAIDGLAGAFLYTDYCGSWLRSFAFDASALEPVGQRQHLAEGERFAQPLSFGEDGSGEVYVLDESGRVWKIVAAGEPEG